MVDSSHSAKYNFIIQMQTSFENTYKQMHKIQNENLENIYKEMHKIILVNPDLLLYWNPNTSK